MNEKNKKEKVPALQTVIYPGSPKLEKTRLLSKNSLQKSKQESQPKKMAEQT